MSKLLSYSKYPLLGFLVILTMLVVGLLVGSGVYEAEAQSPSASDDSCIACHTDQEQLQATVEEEVEVEELSEGEG